MEIEALIEMLLDEPGGPGHLPGGHGVADGVIGQPMFGVPGRRVAVQPNGTVGLLFQPGAQQVGEQLVVAPPAAHLIQRQQEQPGSFHLLEQGLAAGLGGDRVAQRSAEPLQHRGLEQEGAQLLGLVFEHLLGQVVEHEAVAAGERGHEPVDIGLPAYRQRRQLQPGRPALGAGRQRGHRGIGQVGAGGLAQEGRRLVGGEAQLGVPQLGELAPGPQPRQGQRRVGPAGQDGMQARWQVIEQEAQRRMHRLRADQVVVVEHQRYVARTGPGGQFVDQGRYQPLE